MDLDFFPDKFVIEGATTEVRGQLSSKKNEILVHGDQTVISVDDVLVRTLTNGVVERYGVLDVMYQQGYGGDPKLMLTLCLACHAKVTRTLFVQDDWPPFLRELWREQHPDCHEQRGSTLESGVSFLRLYPLFTNLSLTTGKA